MTPEPAKSSARLPAELVSLIHHLELNKAGWWEVALQRLVIAALWIERKPLTSEHIKSYFSDHLGILLDERRIRQQLDALQRDGNLVFLPDGRANLTDRAYGLFEVDIREEEQLRTNAQSLFISAFLECCPSLANDATWLRFNEEFLIPWIRSTGARVYSMVSGDPFDIERISSFEPFVNSHATDHRSGVRNATRMFFEPMRPQIRGYILAQLGALFVLEASSLRSETIARILASNQIPEFKVLLDTNFIFSLLGIHDNPANEAAQAVLEVLEAVRDRVRVKLYVSPATVDETKRALHSRINPLRNIRFTPNVVDAARPFLGGIERLYIEKSQQSGVWVEPEEYFGAYLHDLVPVLRRHGVELYNESMDRYSTRQDVIDDVSVRLEFEKTRYADNARTYEQLVHDISLWHLAKDQRPAVVESPLDATFWILTVDTHFLGFDSFKVRGGVAVCLHPASFVQLMQFWIPRSEKFENALLGSLGLGSLFRVGVETERVTIKILDALSHFENSSELNADTITQVLVNKTLRRKILAAKEIRAEVELVREALVEENRRIATALASVAKREKELVERLATTSAEKVALEKAHESEVSERLRVAAELAAAQSVREELERNNVSLRRSLEAAAERALLLRRFWCRLGFSVTSLLLLFSLSWIGWRYGYFAGGWFHWKAPFARAISAGLLAMSALLIVDRVGLRITHVRDWKLFITLGDFRKWVLGGGGLGAVLVTLAYEAIKGLY